MFVTAPLGLIGATGALLVSNRPFGFVALLGLIALAGMIMRNTVILVDQIDRDIAAGHTRYRAVVVVASPDGRIVAEADGVCEGLIGFARRGTGGFGYDPLFVVPQLGRTMAELPADTKNSISHRGEALRRLRDPLTRALGAVR